MVKHTLAINPTKFAKFLDVRKVAMPSIINWNKYDRIEINNVFAFCPGSLLPAAK
jgi:hypothetical protein